MKIIHNIIFTICVVTLCVYTIHASEQPTQILLETEFSSATMSNQTIDSTQVLETQKKLVAALTQKQEAFEMRYYILAGITLFLVLLFGVLCFFNKRGDKRLQNILSLLEKSKIKEKTTTKNDHFQLAIDETIVVAILENLQAFEKERGFLISKITLHEFAKQLQTNTKYLSKVINTHKLKSFRNYINDLRIQYSIHELENNISYRKYTVKAMAKEVGFTTAESFSKAFQKRTGETVSGFLRHKSQVLSE
jgi:AraC-like DNA-binding protein